MSQLKKSNVEIAWREEGGTVQIQINLPKDDPLATRLKQESNEEIVSSSASSDRTCIPGIFVRNGIRFDKILYEDILYLEAQGAYTLIHTHEREYTISRNLRFCGKGLSYPFMRIHRSYTINVENVDSFAEANVYYQDKRIPVSEPYRKELLAYFNRM